MDKEDKMKDFALGKLNFMLIGAAVVLIAVGCMLMSGGGSTDAIFSKQRISVAPIVTMAGFILMVFGILVGDRKTTSDKDQTEA